MPNRPSPSVFPGDAELRRRLERALALRERLGIGADSTGHRLVNGEGDGLPGLIVDRYGPVAVARVYDDAARRGLVAAGACLAERLGLDAVLGQDRVRGPGPAGASTLALLAGTRPALDRITLTERGLAFAAFFKDAGKPGLYFDQRDTRSWLRATLARERPARVLNLFSFAGAFSVAAAAGGAGEVTSVDATRGCAEAARANLARNGLDADRHPCVAEDAFVFLERAGPDGFDVVIVDPPTFATTKSSRLAGAKGVERLLGAAARALRAGGLLVACTNDTRTTMKAYAGVAARAVRTAGGRTLRLIQVLGLPPDHPTDPARPASRYLKCLAGVVDR